ncbi:Heat shock 70 kDa protein BIP2 [Linum grandiflorum]
MPKPKTRGRGGGGGGGAGDVIGIDLGTTFSCVAVARNGGNPEIIVNDLGNRTTPSFVAFSASDSHLLIGESAKNQAAINPRRTVFDVKRLIGKKFTDKKVQKGLKLLPYTVVDRDGKPYVELEVKPGEVKSFSPEEISAMILGKMKESAESFLGKPVAGAVITVPAYFDDAQRKATKDAGTIAGLNVLRIVNEPTAAALAYGLSNRNPAKRKREKDSSSKILVYDLGGGTFDVSVLKLEDGTFEVLATGGDAHLGGGDFDKNLMDHFIRIIKRKYDKDISGDSRALGRLRKECERAKRDLSSLSQVSIEIECFVNGRDFSEQLTRAKFEAINIHLFKKTIDVVEKTLEDAKIDKSEIDEIILVGGSTRIPEVKQRLKQMFNGKEPNQGVNPDEAVAYGAAVLAANLCGQASAKYGVTLSDVTPLSLGVKVQGGLMSVVIPRNTRIPTKMSQTYYNVDSKQTGFEIEVFQGERGLARYCRKLGGFDLIGIPPAPRGIASGEVTFSIDEDRLLSIVAKDNATASLNPSPLQVAKII